MATSAFHRRLNHEISPYHAARRAGRLIPECDEKGNYKPKQCHGSEGDKKRFCQCWTKTGKILTSPSTKIKSCNCLVQKAETPVMPGGESLVQVRGFKWFWSNSLVSNLHLFRPPTHLFSTHRSLASELQRDRRHLPEAAEPRLDRHAVVLQSGRQGAHGPFENGAQVRLAGKAGRHANTTSDGHRRARSAHRERHAPFGKFDRIGTGEGRLYFRSERKAGCSIGSGCRSQTQGAASGWDTNKRVKQGRNFGARRTRM